MLLLTSLVDRQTGPAGVEHRLIITGATNRSKGRNREMRLFFAATVYERWLIAKNTYLERRKKLKWAIFKHCTLAPFRGGRVGGEAISAAKCYANQVLRGRGIGGEWTTETTSTTESPSVLKMFCIARALGKRLSQLGRLAIDNISGKAIY